LLTVKRRWSDAELGLTLAPLLFGRRHRVGAVAGGAAHAVSSGVGHNNKSGALLNGKLQDELLNGEIFYTLKEAQILIAGWRRLYNGLRPRSSPAQRPPAPETIIWPGFLLADYGPRRSHRR
jgi:hypothetical protein